MLEEMLRVFAQLQKKFFVEASSTDRWVLYMEGLFGIEWQAHLLSAVIERARRSLLWEFVEPCPFGGSVTFQQLRTNSSGEAESAPTDTVKLVEGLSTPGLSVSFSPGANKALKERFGEDEARETMLGSLIDVLFDEFERFVLGKMFHRQEPAYTFEIKTESDLIFCLSRMSDVIWRRSLHGKGNRILIHPCRLRLMDNYLVRPEVGGLWGGVYYVGKYRGTWDVYHDPLLSPEELFMSYKSPSHSLVKPVAHACCISHVEFGMQGSKLVEKVVFAESHIDPALVLRAKWR